MTSLACPVSTCDRMMSISSRVCGGCAADLTNALASVPDLAGDLEITRARLARMGGGGREEEPEPDEPGTVPGVHVQRLPWDDRASRAMAALKNELVGWARVVLDPGVTGSIQFPTDDLASVGRWLHASVKLLLGMDAAPEAVEGIVDAVRRARRAIDRPADKVYAGPCDVCGSDMYAKLGAAVVKCQPCELEYDVEPRRKWLLAEVHDVLGTAVEVARALTTLLRPVTPELIRKWASRGKFAAHGANHLGHPLYRVGDVVEKMPKAS